MATVAAVDQDAEDTFTYELVVGEGDTDNAAFTIVGDKLKRLDAFSGESKASYSIRLKATDAEGLSIVSTATLTNEPPSSVAITPLGPQLVGEGTVAESFAVADILVFYDDALGTNTLSLSGDDAGYFEIVGRQLFFKAGTVVDYETKQGYGVDVVVDDRAVGTTPDLTRGFGLTVVDFNEAPTSLTLSAATISEDVAASGPPQRKDVGTLSVTDPDSGELHTFELVAGEGDTDNGSFEISGHSLEFVGSADFETKTSYSVRVRATDQGGLTVEAVKTITVTDVNEAPVDFALSSSSVPEFRANGTVVGTLSATDPDASDTFTYTLLDSAGGRFSLVGNALQVANGLLLDREQAASHAVSVRVTDSGGLTFTKTLNISVADVSPENVTGNASANTLFGGSAADKFDGAGGNDKLFGQGGNDTLLGSSGNDTLTGGAGRDIMTGGSGADDFDFNSIAETGKTSATRDVIKDFQHLSDDIDLSTIDANGSAAGSGAFKFLAAKGAAFTGVKGQLKWSQINAAGTANDKTIIEGDVNGDKRADFHIELTGLKTLTASDFIL